MNKFFYAYLRLKKRIEGSDERGLRHDDFDSQIIYSFIENALKAESLPKGDGKFDRAFNAINDDLKTLENFVIPNLTGKDEWSSVLLGLRAGLTIAQHQLDIIKKSRN